MGPALVEDGIQTAPPTERTSPDEGARWRIKVGDWRRRTNEVVGEGDWREPPGCNPRLSGVAQQTVSLVKHVLQGINFGHRSSAKILRFSETGQESPRLKVTLQCTDAAFMAVEDPRNEAEPQPYTPRDPCRFCGLSEAFLLEKNGQDTVTCACGRFLYNASRKETGREVRSVRSRPNMKSGLRFSVLERFGFRCIACGRSPEDEVIIQVGHLLSVTEGESLGVPEEIIESEDNLAAMCEECNYGLGRRSLGPDLMYYALLINQRQRQAADGAPAAPPDEAA